VFFHDQVVIKMMLLDIVWVKIPKFGLRNFASFYEKQFN